MNFLLFFYNSFLFYFEITSKNIDTRFRRLVNSIFTEECTGEEIDKIAEVSALIVEKLRKYDLK